MIIKELSLLRLPEVFHLISEILSEEYQPEVLVFLQSAWPQGQLLMLAPDGEVMGFLLGAWSGESESRIMMFGIRPQYRGMGLGSLLLQEFQRRTMMRKGEAIRLEVRPDNMEAINFYMRRGFHLVGFIPQYYKDGGDGLLMRKVISGTSDPRYADYAGSTGISPSGNQIRPMTGHACRSRNGP
ncbi:MAG: GNAT family N-acetyltransferase [Candidatus Methanomethylophilaceae archaeon]